jgi:hypothetical protein
MAVTKISNSSLKNLNKYDSFLAGNAAYEGLGNFNSIQTVTVGAGGATDVEFTAIPQTYNHLQIRFSGLSSTASWMRGYINGDVGNNYSYHDVRGTASNSITIGNGSSLPEMYMLLNSSNTTTCPIVGIIDIFDYANTSKYKTIRSIGGQDGNSSGYAQASSNLWMSTSAVTAIKLNRGTWNQYSTFALYGAN